LCLIAHESALRMSKGGPLYACPPKKGKSTRDKDVNARRGGDASLRRLRSDQMAGM
jgi:hypothetical protein